MKNMVLYVIPLTLQKINGNTKHREIPWNRTLDLKMSRVATRATMKPPPFKLHQDYTFRFRTNNIIGTLVFVIVLTGGGKANVIDGKSVVALS